MEQQENTYALDAENASEMARLIMQDRMITQAIGGVLPELGNQLPHDTHRLLDVGCGPGGWVLDVAFAFPDVEEVVGIDISEIMISYARARALTEEQDCAIFIQGNVLRPLDFPDGYFDLVNARFMVGFLLRDAWVPVLREIRRVTRPGGHIRLTEVDNMGVTTSLALQQQLSWMCQVIQKMGYGFSPDGRDFGMTPMLRKLLTDAGWHNIQLTPHVVDISTGTDCHFTQWQDYMVAFQMLKPLYLKHHLTTEEEFEHSYQLALAQMQQLDFQGLWYLLTAFATKPDEQE